MLDLQDFVKTGRTGRRAYASAPQAGFDFGPYRVSSKVSFTGVLPRRGVAGGNCQLTVVDVATGTKAECTFERVGMPLGSELMHGIAGALDGEPFTVRRSARPRLRRASRVAQVTGAVGLTVGYEHRRSVIRSAENPARLLWTSSSGGLLSRDTSQREAAVICVLVVNAVEQSSSLWRFLSYL